MASRTSGLLCGRWGRVGRRVRTKMSAGLSLELSADGSRMKPVGCSCAQSGRGRAHASNASRIGSLLGEGAPGSPGRGRARWCRTLGAPARRASGSPARRLRRARGVEAERGSSFVLLGVTDVLLGLPDRLIPPTTHVLRVFKVLTQDCQCSPLAMDVQLLCFCSPPRTSCAATGWSIASAAVCLTRHEHAMLARVLQEIHELS